MMPELRIVFLLAALLVGFAPPMQQAAAPVIGLSVQAGFDGLFRENDWFPLLIDVSNDGDGVTGRLVVRPETSGNAFTNTFSTPIDMPTGSRKTAFLYVTARSFATDVRVEFLSDDGVSLAAEQIPLRSVLLQDQLHVVLTESSAGSVDLTGIHAGGFNAFQANWRIANLPDRLAALKPVNTLLFSDIDTGPMTAAQQQTLEDWVVSGGHLIVTGGANWQATAAGLADLLPLVPEASDTTADLGSLVGLTLSRDGITDEETIIATGTLATGARVMAAAEDGSPLLVRHDLGLGTVDYLSADPLSQPLRNWAGLPELWFTLASSLPPQPGWVRGFVDYDRAASATEILPGLDLLPDVLPLCGFLAVYVALIGPLNYAVLNRINRRELAWVTIPVFILIFSGLAWAVGFNLRGNTATISRLAIVQSWPESDRAQVNGLVGLLSPRRSSYTLTLDNNLMMRPLSRTIPANPFAASVQASTDIQQAETFRADNFTVDASFIATFNTAGVIEAPDIGGRVSMFYQPPRFEDEPGHWTIRGSVRNDSNFALNNPVILARGVSLPLDAPLAPGGLETIELPLISETIQPASASPLERSTSQQVNRLSSFSRFSRDTLTSEQSVRDIMGEDRYSNRLYIQGPGRTAEEQETYRRQLLLAASIEEAYLTTGRGNRVFLAGWAEPMPLNTQLEGASWEPMDTTLHIIELEVEVTQPTGSIHIAADQFTWVSTERTGLSVNVAPVETTIQTGDLVTFRFTPLPEAVLADVEALHIEMVTSGFAQADIPVEVWDWQAQEWDVILLERMNDRSNTRRRSIRNPARYLGAENAVQVRLSVDESNNLLRLTRLVVEQDGEF